MSQKSHCSNDTQPACQVLTWLVVRDKYSVHVRSHALAHAAFAWPFSFSLKSIDAKMAGQQHSVYFFSSPGLLEHDFMKKTAREKI